MFRAPDDVAAAVTSEVDAYARRLALRDLGAAQLLRYALPHVIGATSAPFDEVGVALAYHWLLSIGSVATAEDDQSALARGRRLLLMVCERVRGRADAVAAAKRGTYPRHEDDHEGRAFARELRAGRGTDGFGQ